MGKQVFQIFYNEESNEFIYYLGDKDQSEISLSGLLPFDPEGHPLYLNSCIRTMQEFDLSAKEYWVKGKVRLQMYVKSDLINIDEFRVHKTLPEMYPHQFFFLIYDDNEIKLITDTFGCKKFVREDLLDKMSEFRNEDLKVVPFLTSSTRIQINPEVGIGWGCTTIGEDYLNILDSNHSDNVAFKIKRSNKQEYFSLSEDQVGLLYMLNCYAPMDWEDELI